MKEAVSIVIPVFNEEEILQEKVIFLIQKIGNEFNNYEIILTENGSTDNTKNIASNLAKRYQKVIALIDNGIADYGQALISGINKSTFDTVAILELDYLDVDYFNRSIEKLKQFDLVIGSKKISSGIDQRPFSRRLFTYLYNFLLQYIFDLKLTETHGLKTFRKNKLNPIIQQCVTRHAVFPSELVIRSYKHPKIKVCEIPLSKPLREIRKTRIQATKRLRKTISDLINLKKALNN